MATNISSKPAKQQEEVKIFKTTFPDHPHCYISANHATISTPAMKKGSSPKYWVKDPNISPKVNGTVYSRAKHSQAEA
jgi:hypothetical protein